MYRDARILAAFRKMVAFVTDDGRLSATGYWVSEEQALGGLESVFGPHKTFQVSVQQIADKTGVDFGELSKYDGFSAHEERTGEPMVEILETPEDIRV